MFLFKLIKSEECLRPGTEAHVCSFSSLWLSKSSKGKVLGLKGANHGPEGMGEGQQQPPNLTNTPKDSPSLQNTSRISAVSPELQQHHKNSWNPSVTPTSPQSVSIVPEAPKHLRTLVTLQGPSAMGESSTGWGMTVGTTVSSGRRSRDPIAPPPKPSPGLSESSTSPHKLHNTQTSGTPQRASARSLMPGFAAENAQGRSGPGVGWVAEVAACAAGSCPWVPRGEAAESGPTPCKPVSSGSAPLI